MTADVDDRDGGGEGLGGGSGCGGLGGGLQCGGGLRGAGGAGGREGLQTCRGVAVILCAAALWWISQIDLI